MGSIPNRNSLLIGLAVTSTFLVYHAGSHWDELGLIVLLFFPGLPIAFLLLMFSNPKDKPEIDWGMIIAMPFCVFMWPAIALALLVGRPWKDPKWVNRDATKASELERHEA